MKDVRVWDFRTENGVIAAADSTNPYVEGIEKLAQRFLLLLLTEYDSPRYCRNALQPIRGTTFMTQLRNGEFRVEANLTAAFDVAVIMLSGQLRAETPHDAPGEEQLKKAQLEKLVLTEESANLVILIQSMTDEIRFILPLATV